MKRTTLALDEDLLLRLKRRAAAEGRTVQAMANEALRKGLARSGRRTAYRLELHGWVADALPGVDPSDRDRLYDVMEPMDADR